MPLIIQTADYTTPESIEAMPRDHRDWMYNGLDCCVTLEIKDVIEPQLDETTSATYEFSKALQAPIFEMTTNGMLVDKPLRRKMVKLLREDIDRVTANLRRMVWEIFEFDFNPASPKQVMELFYGHLGIKPIKKRKQNGTYGPSADRDTLEKLSAYFYAQPFVNHLLFLRDTTKKLQFLETDMDKDGVIRSSFNIAGTVTGRLSSYANEFGTGTNTQNVGRSLRSTFIPREGMKYANLDLEQADSRNLGALMWNIFLESHGSEVAGAYLDACESGDLHTRVAMGAYPHLPWTDDLRQNKLIADDTSNYAYRDFTFRDQAKRLGHGSNFYGKPAHMAKQTHIPQHDVEVFQRNYFRTYATIPLYHKWVRQQLHETSQLTTLLGRRRTFWGRPNDDKTLRDAIAYSPR